MKYSFQIHREGKGYWAECLELMGCKTQANSIRQLEKNMKEALNLYLDEPEGSKVLYSFPKKDLYRRSSNIIQVPVDTGVAFAFLLRQIRLRHGMTQKEAAKLIFNSDNIYSYQRLESSKTANPEFKTLVRIKGIFPEFDLDEILSA